MKHLSFLIFGALLAPVFQLHAAPPGTAFTYQGRLNDGGNPANGSYVFRLSLDDGNNASVGTPITTPAVNVSNGLFTVTLDFGPGIFTGANRQLNIEVHTNDNVSPFVLLTPPQPILPTPYAIYAGNVDAAGISGIIPASSLSGSYSNAVNLTNVNNVFAGNGTGVTNVNAVTLGGLNASNFWKLGGNAGTTPGTHFLGTSDNQPLEIKVNNLRALRIENNGDGSDPGTEPDGAPNLIGGSPANFVGAGVVGATIAGGGATNYYGIAYTNTVLSDFGVIGGGAGNTISTNQNFETIAGGFDNHIGGRSTFSYSMFGYSSMNVIGGGTGNTIEGPPIPSDSGFGGNTIAGGLGNTVGSNMLVATIGGGQGNRINSGFAFGSSIAGGIINSISAAYSSIAGGHGNNIGTNSAYSAIGGGENNNIAANSSYATIPGGRLNEATNYAFAAGNRAKAVHTGAFVWADSMDADFASTATNQFAVRAQNGVLIQGTNNVLDLRGDGAIRIAGAGVGSRGPVFIHRADSGNISGHITTIDHPLANGDPNAILLVTHNYTADTAVTKYEPNPVGVWYDGSRWTIYHENAGVAMPVGRAFNVMIIKP